MRSIERLKKHRMMKKVEMEYEIYDMADKIVPF